MSETTLARRLKLTTEEKTSIGKTTGRIKGVVEFLSDAADGVKDMNWIEALAEAAPWAGAIGEAVGEALPPIKFLLKLAKKFTEIKDPDALAHLASSMAFESFLRRALR